MLQISTGKLFTQPIGWSNNLSGILYTNATFFGIDEKYIETEFGKVTPTSAGSTFPRTVLYELNEHMEGDGTPTPGLLISCTIDSYIEDFSCVISFALNSLFTHNIDLANRLLSGKKGINTRAAPSEYLSNFFKNNNSIKSEQLSFLKFFISELHGLHRKDFLRVMRSIKTYINGLHRIADDIELAYTLIVVSIESLAADSSIEEVKWESIESKKRNDLEEAFAEIPEEKIANIKKAILKNEFNNIYQKFRKFVTDNTPSDYFRNDDLIENKSLAKFDLNDALYTAYDVRSRYVHQSLRLPDLVALPYKSGETIFYNGNVYFTLQGLSKIARNSIIEYIKKLPKIEKESYNYALERSNVVVANLSPEYWVGSVFDGFINHGQKKLSGLIEIVSDICTKTENTLLPDIKNLTEELKPKLTSLIKAQRLPYYALIYIFNTYVIEEQRIELDRKTTASAQRELNEPSLISLITHTVTRGRIEWPIEIHEEFFNAYLKNRLKPNKIKIPRYFEAAMSLDLAERYRLLGSYEMMRAKLSIAVELHPGHKKLMNFERDIIQDQIIDTISILSN